MQSILSALERPSNKVGENNACLRNMHHEKKKEKLSRKRWTYLEDWKLSQHVVVFGPKYWKHIAEKLHGRTERTCRSRWYHHLDPKIKKGAFSCEEERMLLEAQRELGNKWVLIAKRFHGRSDMAVKNHWKNLVKRLKKQSTSRTMERLTHSPQVVTTYEDTKAAPSQSSSLLPYSVVTQRYIDFLGVGDSHCYATI